MQIKPLSDYWVVVSIANNVMYSTISQTEQESKECFVCKQDWQIAESNGYRCVKVDITFTVKE